MPPARAFVAPIIVAAFWTCATSGPGAHAVNGHLVRPATDTMRITRIEGDSEGPGGTVRLARESASRLVSTVPATCIVLVTAH